MVFARGHQHQLPNCVFEILNSLSFYSFYVTGNFTKWLYYTGVFYVSHVYALALSFALIFLITYLLTCVVRWCGYFRVICVSWLSRRRSDQLMRHLLVLRLCSPTSPSSKYSNSGRCSVPSSSKSRSVHFISCTVSMNQYVCMWLITAVLSQYCCCNVNRLDNRPIVSRTTISAPRVWLFVLLWECWTVVEQYDDIYPTQWYSPFVLVLAWG